MYEKSLEMRHFRVCPCLEELDVPSLLARMAKRKFWLDGFWPQESGILGRRSRFSAGSAGEAGRTSLAPAAR